MRAWFLATPLRDELAADGRDVIEVLRSDAARDVRASQAFAFIYGVCEHALDVHFREPLTRLGVGLLTRQALGVALDLALRGLRTPLRRVIEGMDDEQLLGVADEIETRLYPDPHG